MLLSGMSTSVVTPPAAAASVAVSNPSHSVRPGSLMCTWVSTSPGRSTSPSARRTIERALSSVSNGATTAMRPSRTPITHATSRSPTTARGATNAVSKLSVTTSSKPLDKRRHRQPGLARVGSVVADNCRLDQAIWPIGSDEDLALIAQPEGAQVDQEVMLVGGREPDLGDVAEALQHPMSHLVERLLQGTAVGRREGLEQRCLDRGVPPVPVPVRPRVPPSSHERGREDPIVGLLQGGVFVFQIPLEL